MKPILRLILLLCLALAGLARADAVNNSPAKLVIIAPDNFVPALKDFAAFKQKLLPTELVSLTSVLQSSPGVDDPEKVKHYLYRLWKNERLGYALLVGDVDLFPVRYMVLDRATPAAFDYAFYPSDLYYSDLAKADGSFEDWNGRKDSFHAGYFGEVRGEKNKQDGINFDQIHYLPEIAVGRWPVSTPAEAVILASKTMAYERASLANAAPLRRAAFLAVGGWVDSRNLLDTLAGHLPPGWSAAKCFYASLDQPSTNPPTHAVARRVFNDGAGLVIHTGHGASDRWEGCFNPADLDQLTNDGALPVVMSAGCSTASFAPLPPYEGYIDVEGKAHKGTDHGEVFQSPPPPPAPYQTGAFNPTCLGEQLLKRNAHGAVAYIGCDTGSQPCGLTLVDGFVSAIGQSANPRLGDCWASAVRYYYTHERLADLKPNDDWYPPSIFFQAMKFMLFGDPSLQFPSAVKSTAN
jgi:hypothetical protein